jgi:hypothetical protein
MRKQMTNSKIRDVQIVTAVWMVVVVVFCFASYH